MAAKEEAKAAAPAAEPAAPKTSIITPAVIIALVHTLAVLATLGLLVYTRILYKRPVITEESERERLEAKKHKTEKEQISSGLVVFEPMTVNIQSVPARPAPADGTQQQIQGKLHYATVGFALELRDMNQKEKIEALRPKIMDWVVSSIGHKQFSELTTVQGRYLLRSQIVQYINRLAAKQDKGQGDDSSEEALITNIYFNQFIVQ